MVNTPPPEMIFKANDSRGMNSYREGRDLGYKYALIVEDIPLDHLYVIAATLKESRSTWDVSAYRHGFCRGCYEARIENGTIEDGSLNTAKQYQTDSEKYPRLCKYTIINTDTGEKTEGWG